MNQHTLNIDVQMAGEIAAHFLMANGVTGMPQGRMAATIAHALQKQFNKGDRVYSTEFAFQQGLVKSPLVYGTVAATPRRCGIPNVSILIDGHKYPQRFHSKFWDRFFTENTA